MACARAGFGVLGLDVDPEKVAALKSRKSYIDAVNDTVLYALIAQHARIVVDTRNVMEREGFSGPSIIEA
jgi:UDP-N-acetyl-D-mannosaminuronate dehydrogenase